MSLTEESRERVEEWVDEFDARYESFEVVEDRMELSPDHYETDRRRIEAGENGGAGLWVTDVNERVLLVRDEGDDGWVDPGGKREADESFAEAARRETREETGLDCVVTGLLSAHVTELVDATDPERPALYSLIAIFTGEPVADDPMPRPREGEIAAVDWFETPPDTVGYPAVADRPFPAAE